MQQERILEQLGTTIKQGAAKLYCKRGRWYLALSVTVPTAPCAGERVAGVDMGLRYLAGVGIIRMKKLECIRRRKARKHDFGRSLHSWSFYRLQQFIAYAVTRETRNAAGAGR